MNWFEKFTLTPGWWATQEDPCVVSTQVRIVRNVENYSFPSKLPKVKREELNEILESALEEVMKPVKRVRVHTKGQREFFTERHILNPLSAVHEDVMILTDAYEEHVAILQDRDHLRFLIRYSGLPIEKLLNEYFYIARKLSYELNFAFDPSLGFLTSSLTNTGLGMRFSTILFIPGLFLAGILTPLLNIATMPVILRGFYGNGSQVQGYFVEIASKPGLGISEKELAKMFEDVVNKVVDAEKKAREQLLATRFLEIEDKVMRAIGLLETARIIDAKEAMELLSMVKFGIIEDIEVLISEETVNNLLFWTQEEHFKHLQDVYDSSVSERRAKYIEEKLRESEEEE